MRLTLFGGAALMVLVAASCDDAESPTRDGTNAGLASDTDEARRSRTGAPDVGTGATPGHSHL